MPSDLVPIGAVVRAHGVRGVVRVRAFGSASEALSTCERVFVGKSDRPLRVETASRDKDEYLVKLEGIADRDAAEALRGSELKLPRAELPEIADDEVYIDDLVGCELVDAAGKSIGRVLRVESSTAQPLLVVARSGGGEVLVPFVEPIVTSVDLAARRIVCDPPEGLLDLEGL